MGGIRDAAVDERWGRAVAMFGARSVESCAAAEGGGRRVRVLVRAGRQRHVSLLAKLCME